MKRGRHTHTHTHVYVSHTRHHVKADSNTHKENASDNRSRDGVKSGSTNHCQSSPGAIGVIFYKCQREHDPFNYLIFDFQSSELQERHQFIVPCHSNPSLESSTL
jgi:hypothetical protein